MSQWPGLSPHKLCRDGLPCRDPEDGAKCPGGPGSGVLEVNAQRYPEGFLLTPLTGKGMVQVNITDWCMSTAIRWLSTATVSPEPISGI
ncbi:hypothetical protein Taro_008542 [Colocasia esculenta]|uniref:Uncharacterized protein n=1 Tax=Colocasia esculenta TaxID=4460 RepID=A0A843U2M4_COLES|nr:hypothetical protein [Colocasia esculenta]